MAHCCDESIIFGRSEGGLPRTRMRSWARFARTNSNAVKKMLAFWSCFLPCFHFGGVNNARKIGDVDVSSLVALRLFYFKAVNAVPECELGAASVMMCVGGGVVVARWVFLPYFHFGGAINAYMLLIGYTKRVVTNAYKIGV